MQTPTPTRGHFPPRPSPDHPFLPPQPPTTTADLPAYARRSGAPTLLTRAADAVQALLSMRRHIPVAPSGADEHQLRVGYDYALLVLRTIAQQPAQSSGIAGVLIRLGEKLAGHDGVAYCPSFEQFLQMRADGDVGRQAVRAESLADLQQPHAHELLNVRLVGIHHQSVLLRLHELEQDRFLVRVQPAQHRKPIAFELDLRAAPPPPDKQPA